MFSMQKIAKIAGFGYLIIFITGFFSNFFVLENLYIPGDGFATATNIVHSDILYRIGIFSFILMVLFDVLLAWALYMISRGMTNTYHSSTLRAAPRILRWQY